MQRLPVSPSRWRRGAISMEHVFGAALAVVIIAAIVLTIWSTMFRGPKSSATAGTPHFQCMECEHVFEVENIPREAIRNAPDPSMVMLDCPSCGSQGTAVQMVRCPKCGEYYLGQKNEFYYENGYPAPEDVRDVCPHCGTDRLKYMQENP